MWDVCFHNQIVCSNVLQPCLLLIRYIPIYLPFCHHLLPQCVRIVVVVMRLHCSHSCFFLRLFSFFFNAFWEMFTVTSWLCWPFCWIVHLSLHCKCFPHKSYREILSSYLSALDLFNCQVWNIEFDELDFFLVWNIKFQQIHFVGLG